MVAGKVLLKRKLTICGFHTRYRIRRVYGSLYRLFTLWLTMAALPDALRSSFRVQDQFFNNPVLQLFTNVRSDIDPPPMGTGSSIRLPSRVM